MHPISGRCISADVQTVLGAADAALPPHIVDGQSQPNGLQSVR